MLFFYITITVSMNSSYLREDDSKPSGFRILSTRRAANKTIFGSLSPAPHAPTNMFSIPAPGPGLLWRIRTQHDRVFSSVSRTCITNNIRITINRFNDERVYGPGPIKRLCGGLSLSPPLPQPPVKRHKTAKNNINRFLFFSLSFSLSLFPCVCHSRGREGSWLEYVERASAK